MFLENADYVYLAALFSQLEENRQEYRVIHNSPLIEFLMFDRVRWLQESCEANVALYNYRASNILDWQFDLPVQLDSNYCR